MSNAENVSPQTLRAVARELRELAARPPDGIKLTINDADLTDIRALIHGPEGTPYAEGVFCVRVVLGRDFPLAPPKAYFLTKIFHPNVSAAGEVCVNTLKKDWKADLGIRHVLLAVKCLLIAPNAESALNAEAGALLRDHYDAYFQRARLLTEIHARPRPPPPPQDEGPCAKRERRPLPAPPSPAAPPAPAAHAAADKRHGKDKRRILKRL